MHLALYKLEKGQISVSKRSKMDENFHLLQTFIEK
jgi:hypothetical protein